MFKNHRTSRQIRSTIDRLYSLSDAASAKGDYEICEIYDERSDRLRRTWWEHTRKEFHRKFNEPIGTRTPV